MSKHLDTVEHDYIRYSNCWEDARLLLKGLDIKPGEKCLSIASAGDNSFSMLSADPSIVVAADINTAQLHLCELKKAAITKLNHGEYLEFCGILPNQQRTATYNKIRDLLPQATAKWWDERKEDINTGIIHIGKFEKYFSIFRRKVMPFVHSRKRIRILLENKTAQQQSDYFKKSWNSYRWRCFFKLFFSKFVMGKLGRDPKFLKEVNIPVSRFILNQSAAHLSSVSCQNNSFLHYIFNGNYTFPFSLPHYVEPDAYAHIQKNISRITFHHGLLEDIAKEHGTFDVVNLSNIFEYMNRNYFEQTAQNLAAYTHVASRLAYWNLMVKRELHNIHPNVFSNMAFHRSSDDGFFYMNFLVSVHSKSTIG
jgi:S-adenosylmethionine-diacylglycerol 3-amino-3-carboxypropyl transferase